MKKAVEVGARCCQRSEVREEPQLAGCRSEANLPSRWWPIENPYHVSLYKKHRLRVLFLMNPLSAASIIMHWIFVGNSSPCHEQPPCHLSVHCAITGVVCFVVCNAEFHNNKKLVSDRWLPSFFLLLTQVTKMRRASCFLGFNLHSKRWPPTTSSNSCQ